MEESLKKQLEEFFGQRKVVKYKRGEIILKPGEKPSYIGYIKSGYVRVYTLNEAGQEVTTQFFKPILYFTVIFAVAGIENRYYFEAITPVEIQVAPIEETMQYIKSNPEVSRRLMNNVMLAFLDMVDQMGYLLSGTAYNKVAAMLASLTSRAEGEGTNYSKIDFGITHRLIASLTGLTRETVTLQMIRLEKEGILFNKNRKLVILNRKELIKAARAEVK